MSRTIVYDGVRLFLGAATQAPRGVDRVDLLYARNLLEHWPGECLGMLPTPWGTRLYDRGRGLRLLDAIEALWRETADAETDQKLEYVQRRLAGETPTAPDTRHRGAGALARQARLLAATGFTFGRSAAANAPRDALYLNIGQLGWAVPWSTRWLRQRPDIRAVFMLHDVIPLLHPELVSFGGRLAQRWMLAAVSRYANGLITTTDVAGDAVLRAVEPHPRPIVTTGALHLPVSPAFLDQETPDEALSGQAYFLICGAIEPRKNHLLLLKVWRRLVGERGAAAPRLVIVGSPAHAGGSILRQFEQCIPLRSHVVTVSGLSSPGVRRLMANARAVLMPSFAEGFGLPIIEALAVGTPVLASDLPAHREVGGDLASYIDPTDEAAWLDGICRMTDMPDLVDDLRRRIASYRPMTAPSYFARIQQFLERIP
jgi:glycosyltransferase involved in cell wall biosynthesis